MIPGEIYQTKNLDPDNPFAEPPTKVTIMEIRDGYVRYRFDRNGRDNGMKIERFFEIYEPEGGYKSPEEKPKKPARRIEINEDISPQ